MVDVTKHLIYSYTSVNAYHGTERIPTEEITKHRLTYLTHAVIKRMVNSSELRKLLRDSVTEPAPGFIETKLVVLPYDDYEELLTTYERSKHAATSQEANK